MIVANGNEQTGNITQLERNCTQKRLTTEYQHNFKYNNELLFDSIHPFHDNECNTCSHKGEAKPHEAHLFIIMTFSYLISVASVAFFWGIDSQFHVLQSCDLCPSECIFGFFSRCFSVFNPVAHNQYTLASFGLEGVAHNQQKLCIRSFITTAHSGDFLLIPFAKFDTQKPSLNVLYAWFSSQIQSPNGHTLHIGLVRSIYVRSHKLLGCSGNDYRGAFHGYSKNCTFSA